MNKTEFIDFVSTNNKITKKESEKNVNMIFTSIEDALARKKDINIVGFGSFSVTKREAREGHHPKTGEKIQIKAYNQPVFKASKTLKEKCNSQ